MTLVVESTVRGLTEVWAGDRTHGQVTESGELRIEGGRRDAARLWTWLGSSAFAPTRRKAVLMAVSV